MVKVANVTKDSSSSNLFCSLLTKIWILTFAFELRMGNKVQLPFYQESLNSNLLHNNWLLIESTGFGERVRI